MPKDTESIRRTGDGSDDRIAQEASRWVVRWDRGLSQSEVEELTRWLASDTRHAAEYARVNRGWRRLDEAVSDPRLVAMADQVERKARFRQGRGRRRWLVPLGAAAVVAFAATIFVRSQMARNLSSPESVHAAKPTYSVLLSTARAQTLPDGSVAELNGNSRILVDFIPSERRVRLLNGEAHFTVTKNPARPFYVSAGSVAVCAVGTAFDVRLTVDSVSVLVTEGKVRLAKQDAAPVGPGAPAPSRDEILHALTAGKRALVPTATKVKRDVIVDDVSPADLDAALAWKSTQLIFDHTPLDQVVEAFNRYNPHQLVLADSSLNARTLTGVFRADNLAGFVRLLRASADVAADPRDDGKTVLRAITP